MTSCSKCKLYYILSDTDLPHCDSPSQYTQTAMALIKPGIHWDAIHRHCHVVLARGFIRLGIFKPPSAPDPETALIRAGATVPFFPHGLGHSLGLDVHDVPSASKPPESLGKGHPSELDIYKYLRLRRSLKAGMVVVRNFFFVYRQSFIMPTFGYRRLSQEYISILICLQMSAIHCISTTPCWRVTNVERPATAGSVA
jgi:hypothetical protein